MKAIILAAGRGSRMKKLTEERPKCLIELKGVHLIEWQINALRGAGINQIGIVTGYKHEFLRNFNLFEFYNPRWAETNMVSSLAYAEEWLLSEPCIVSYSDIFYDSSAVKLLLETNADLAVTYDPQWLTLWEKRFDDPLIDAESFRITPDNIILEIGKKPSKLDDIQGQYMGLLRFSPKGWSEVVRIRSQLSDRESDKMHMTGTLQKVIDEGKIDIIGFPYNGIWGEIDNENDLSLWNNELPF